MVPVVESVQRKELQGGLRETIDILPVSLLCTVLQVHILSQDYYPFEHPPCQLYWFFPPWYSACVSQKYQSLILSFNYISPYSHCTFHKLCFSLSPSSHSTLHTGIPVRHLNEEKERKKRLLRSCIPLH